MSVPGDSVRTVLTFDAELWLWDARVDSWTFVSLPTDLADDILDAAGATRRGFGSVRVEVTVGRTVWRTSLFPDTGRGTYVLPVKRAVREAEDLHVGRRATFGLRLIDA